MRKDTMTETRAVVILHSHDLSDPHPKRSLSIGPESDHINIGRASKRENKNLAPSSNNALFDSRVMSRNHAILKVSLEKKLVYLCDPGSMHGTYVNGKHVQYHKDVTISDNDVLTFGVEVVRGSETFPPLAVRLELQWIETPTTSASQIDGVSKNLQGGETVYLKSRRTNNTFRVPDDDDDDVVECEIIQDNRVTLDLTGDQGSDLNVSGAGSESEDSLSVIEVPSPATSPLKSNELKEARPADPPAANTQQPSQAVVEPSNGGAMSCVDPLVTPGMTPPSAGYDSDEHSGENQYYDKYFAHGSDEDSSAGPEDWDQDGQEDEEEIDIDEEDEDESEEVEEEEEDDDDDEEDEEEDDDEIEEEEEDVDEGLEEGILAGTKAVTDSLRSPYDINSHASTHPRQAGLAEASEGFDKLRKKILLGATSPEKQDELQAVAAVDPQKISTPASHIPESTTRSCGTGPQQGEALYVERPYSINIPPPSHILPSLGPNTQTTFPHCTPVPDQYSNALSSAAYTPPHLPRYPFAPACQSSYPSKTSYNDGPFTTSQAVPTTAGRSSMYMLNSNPKPDLMPFMDPLAPLIPRTSCVSNVKPNSAAVSATSAWNTTSTGSAVSSLKKRKAAEMEPEPTKESYNDSHVLSTDLPADATKLTDDDTNLPDAQPQAIAAILNSSESQLTAVSIPESTKVAKEDERPPKLVKTSHRGSIGTHAATAIFGAVVGAVGTIAALASLPADYFA
ncbi:hypothetical protein BJY04DRAFT_15698 [Aspergillus karnatakaensis]|uniref:FHA domain protein n=1 Tax=Aspergillus karnatakaensis TaxID=1810916 RepID=UPI003CCDA61A